MPQPNSDEPPITETDPAFDTDLGGEAGDSATPPIPKADSIELDGFRLEVNYFLSKDYEDIATASVELPAIIEWVNCKLQSLTEQRMRKEDEVKEYEADAWFFLQNGGWEDLGYAGRKNAHALLMGCRLDPKVKKAKQELAILTSWTQRLFNVMTSLQAKLELVRSAEATRRRVFDNQTNHQT